ncbi:hypothetical protein BaRGS_00003259 [Batillaria attramentaria]|uniref:Uncharacterized protein n=1 Tax=Batillaria attramentaria TaxID=370345 RepID=A0ABD0M1B7_9CAEN
MHYCTSKVSDSTWCKNNPQPSVPAASVVFRCPVSLLFPLQHLSLLPSAVTDPTHGHCVGQRVTCWDYGITSPHASCRRHPPLAHVTAAVVS